MQREVNLVAIFGIVLLVILLVVAALTLTQCGSDVPQPTEPSAVTDPTEEETQPTETEEPTEPPHVHAWEETVTAPDCISEGYTTYVCACGESYVGDKIEALGHSWKDATCTEPKTCTVCGASEGRAKDHTWDDGKVTKEAVEGWEGKPGEDGEMLYTCTVCKATKTQAIPSPDHVHDYTHSEKVILPTCTEGGYTSHFCRCGDEKKDSEVPPLGHTLKKGNCVTADSCSVCGAVLNAAPGHDWKDATCTEPMICKVCGQTTGIPKGHKEQIINGKEPTCTETGLTEGKKCSVCGETLLAQEVIPAKGHTETTVKGKEPTCTETGLTDGIQCSVSACKTWIKEQEVLPALGHKEETVRGYEPTCINDGLTDGIQCSVAACKAWIKEQKVIPALGHTETTVKGKDPTCTETGLTDGIQCSVDTCKVWVEKQKTIPALGHDYSDWVVKKVAECEVDGYKERTCSRCGDVETVVLPAPGHTEETVKGYPETCTTDGLTDGIKCTVCGKWIDPQEKIPAPGHNWSEWIVREIETCLKDGYKERTCLRCGKVETEIIIAPGHAVTTIKGYAATYTTTGLTDGKKCTVCKAVLVEQEVIPLLEATVTLDPNGGMVTPGSITVTYNSKYGNLPEPIRTGYTLNGWKLNGKTVTNETTVTTVGDHTLKADWIVHTYTVVYNANGGTGTTASSTHTYDQSKTLTTNGFSRHGWTFLGWSTSPNATAATYSNGQSVKNLTAIKDGRVTLYAVWRINTVYYYTASDRDFDIGITADGFEYNFTIDDKVNLQDLCSQGYSQVRVTFNYTITAYDTIKTDSNGSYGYLRSDGYINNIDKMFYESPDEMKLSETTKSYSYSGTTSTSNLISNNWICFCIWIHASGGLDFVNEGSISDVSILVEFLK